MRWHSRAETVMDIAKQFAKRYNHEVVNSGDVLAGLFGEGCSIAAEVLKSFGMNVYMIFDKMEKRNLDKDFSPDYQNRDLFWTSGAVNITQNAPKEALKLGHSYVGPEHLLLAICQTSENGITEGYTLLAGEIIKDCGADVKEIRSKILIAVGFVPSKESDEDMCAGMLLEGEEADSDVTPKPNTEIAMTATRAKQILEKYTRRAQEKSTALKSTPEKPDKKPAHRVILEKIVDICRSEFNEDQETYFKVLNLIVLCELLQNIEIPKREIEYAIHKLAAMKNSCSLNILVETIEKLKKYFREV